MSREQSREQRLARVFVELADTMVAEFDVIDFLHTLVDRSVELLHADAAGIMLADQRGDLRVLASSNESARLLEAFELQSSGGPCLECFNSGQPVVNVDLDDVESRWPRFKTVTEEAGYQSVHALPLRLRSQVIGAMNLFCENRTTLNDDDLVVGQALSDVATIGLLQERAVRQKEVLAEQLQSALNSRVLIEQAKGALAERDGLEVDEAFRRMRAYARAGNTPLRAVATAVIDGSIDATALQRS